MDEKWDRILLDRVVMTWAISGIISAMFVPLLIEGRRFTVSLGEKDTVFTAVEHPVLFRSVIALCVILFFVFEFLAVRRLIRLKQNEENA